MYENNDSFNFAIWNKVFLYAQIYIIAGNWIKFENNVIVYTCIYFYRPIKIKSMKSCLYTEVYIGKQQMGVMKILFSLSIIS